MFEEIDSKPAAARAISILFSGALLTLSSVTTAAFFWEYAPMMFDFLSPVMSPYLASLTGIVCFELASVVWSWLRANDSDTASQLSVANVGAWASMIGGLTVTALYFALNSSLIANRLDDAAIFTVSIFGGLLIIAGVAGNFALAFIYRNSAAGHVAAGNLAELRAMQSSARHAAQLETTRATLTHSLAEIRKTLPTNAARQGQDNARQWEKENFTISQNGRG